MIKRNCVHPRNPKALGTVVWSVSDAVIVPRGDGGMSTLLWFVWGVRTLFGLGWLSEGLTSGWVIAIGEVGVSCWGVKLCEQLVFEISNKAVEVKFRSYCFRTHVLARKFGHLWPLFWGEGP